MTAYCGVDPGQTGGLALVTATGVLNAVESMPTIGGEVSGHGLRDLLEGFRATTQDRLVVVIEEVHSMPQQGVASTFKFGKSFGIAIGVVQALGYPMERVRPQEWKKSFSLNGKDKDASRRLATELWPSMQFHWKRKADNGLSDAALIAEHARRSL